MQDFVVTLKCDEFTSQFTAHRHHLEIVVVLNDIYQRKKEALREYINTFTKEVVGIRGTNEKLK